MQKNDSFIKKAIFSGILEESPTNEDNSATIKAKYFYQSCMNMSTYFLFTFYLNFIFYLMFLAQIEEVSDMPLLNVIEKLGGWPVTDPNWDETKAIDLETLVAVIKRNFTLGVLIEEWVGPDDRNSEKHIIQVSFVYLKG